MKWVLKPKAPEEFIKQFPEYSPLVLQLLYNRGLKTQAQIDEFFNPDYGQDLHDPFLMLGIKEAVKRILKAIKKQEKIAIFGDYDADGVCGAVILKTILEELSANLNGGVYIPDRKLEGYGLNIEAVKKLGNENVKLILTVDCGVSDFEEIKLANSLGIEVIIFDHHRVGEKLPLAKIIVDPWQKKDHYPFKELSAAGVVFKFVQALIKNSKIKNFTLSEVEGQNSKLPDGWEKWLLDLVAIATVADCMPLLGENRTLVRYGLIVLAQTRRLGLQELMKVARLNPIFEVDTQRTNLDTYSLGFILGPRLNAAGRMDHASLAFELLSASDRERARQLAKKINQQNQERQKLTDEIVVEVEQKIVTYLDDKSQPVIIEFDKNWSLGVIGLVAGKICDRYHRPTIIFKEEEGESRGSARSISAFDIIEAIGQCAELLKEFGGHPGAAGLALENKNLSAFKEKINQIARAKLKAEDLVPKLEIDAQISPGDITWEFFDELVRFEPYGGEGNPMPLFLIKDLEIVSSRAVGNTGQHLKLELSSSAPSPLNGERVGLPAEAPLGGAKEGVRGEDENKKFKAIGFNQAAKNGHLKTGDKIDLVFELIVDEWNGSRELQFKIIDIRKSV